MSNQFRKLNQPTFLDKTWNLSRKFLYKNLHSNIYFEFGSYFYRFKENIKIQREVYFKRNSIVGCANTHSKIFIGEKTTIGFGSIIISSLSISIGKNCMIAPYVHIVDSNHGYDSNQNFAEQNNINKAVIIGDNCWLGSGVKVLSGVKIGDNCIVAAGAVVKDSFGDNSIVGGVPAKLLRMNND
jgi:acetyltransferase-like isoleucine patch superfamily enzyme